jgi:hypothetical protein
MKPRPELIKEKKDVHAKYFFSLRGGFQSGFSVTISHAVCGKFG